MPQCQFPVFCYFVFQKTTQEIISELDETKPEPPIFLGHKTRTEGEPEGGQGAASPKAGAPPLPARGGVVGLLATL
jgi:hypothetical protein